MSKSVGIVAEYNPFHTGHRYQIDLLKKMGYENIAVCMSGSCVQRGELAFMSKFTRAEMAIENGVSLVAEMPYPFSARSAEGFAMAGMQTLKALGVDAISFGSECADKDLLQSIADYLLSEEYETELKKYLEVNLPFAKAREKAIFAKFDISSGVISARNDILAIEYLKACKKLGWAPEVVVIQRQGAGYNDTEASGGFASAGGMRKMVSENRLDTLWRNVPAESLKTFENNFYRGQYFLPDDTAYEKAVLFVLRQKKYENFISAPDCNTELAHAFEKCVSNSTSLTSLFDSLPTKHYTKARLNRIILSVFLGCEKLPDNIQYIRLLGVAKDKEAYLKEVGKRCPLPISHSAKILSEKSEECRLIVSAESLANDTQSTFFKISSEARSDYTSKFIKK